MFLLLSIFCCYFFLIYLFVTAKAALPKKSIVFAARQIVNNLSQIAIKVIGFKFQEKTFDDNFQKKYARFHKLLRLPVLNFKKGHSKFFFFGYDRHYTSRNCDRPGSVYYV